MFKGDDTPRLLHIRRIHSQQGHSHSILRLHVSIPSTNHTQLARTFGFLGTPEDFIFIVTSLYKEAHTTFQTPHDYARLIKVLRGTLQGDPLSLLVILLMVKPLIRWLESGYSLTSNQLTLSNKPYTDDATLLAFAVLN